MSTCIRNNTEYCFLYEKNIDNNDEIHTNIRKIYIKDYLNDKELMKKVLLQECKLVCDMCKQPVLKYESKNKKSHFKHFPKQSDNKMSEWYKNWQNFFLPSQREIKIGTKRADIIVKKLVIEFQHSIISREEVDDRNKNAKKNMHEIIWVVDGINVVLDENKLYFGNCRWINKSFKNTDHIFLHIGENIYKINTKVIKYSHFYEFLHKKSSDFLQDLKKGEIGNWEKIKNYSGTLFFNQRGAGNGKTYESIQIVLEDSQFSTKNTFIYLTKTHSAKEVIKQEFEEQIKGIEYNKEENNKKYIYSLNLNGRPINIIIATIDSLVYALSKGIFQKWYGDMFQNKLEDIINKDIKNVSVDKLTYAGNKFYFSEKTLIVVDEAQDLPRKYIDSFTVLSESYHIDLYIIGDKLQTIYQNNNVFTEIDINDTEIHNMNIVRCENKNIVRRFHNEKLKDFVNFVICFKNFGLPEIQNICDGNCKYKHTNEDCVDMFNLKMGVYDEDWVLNPYIEEIIKKIDNDVQTYNYLPENFLFIFPVISRNKLAEYLSIRLEQYWSEKLNSNKLFYTFIHKSEVSKPIDLNESIGCSRFISIHASKGMGCEIVYLLGMSQKNLDYYLREYDPNGIKYESLIHVAITRQKQKLYIGFENSNDLLTKKFGFYEISDEKEIDNGYLDFSLPKFEKIFEIDEKLLDRIECIDCNDKTCQKCCSITEFTNYINNNIGMIPINKRNNIMIDWNHHDLRYKCYISALYIKSIPSDKILQNKNQYFTVLNKLSKMKIQNFGSWKEYRKIRDEFKRKKRNYNFLPIVISKNELSNKYENCLKKIFENIAQKIKYFSENKNGIKGMILCPLERIILNYFLYFLNICYDFLYQNEIIYIISIYEQVSNHEDHCFEKYGCKCNDFFICNNKSVVNDNFKEIRDSITNHYNLVSNLDKNFDLYEKNILNFTNQEIHYNCAHRIYFSIKDDNEQYNTLLYKRFEMIGYTEDCIIPFLIVTKVDEFNNGNFLHELILIEFLFKFMKIEGHKEKEEKDITKSDNHNKFSNKKIVCCVFQLNNEPILIELNFIQSNEIFEISKKYFKNLLCQFYDKYHKKINSNFISHSEFLEWDDKIEFNYPNYISSFILIENNKIKTINKKLSKAKDKKKLKLEKKIDKMSWEKLSSRLNSHFEDILENFLENKME